MLACVERKAQRWGERKKKVELHVEQSDESTRLIQRRRCICGCRLLLFTSSSSIYWNFGQKFHFEDEKYSTLIKRTATVTQQATLVHLVGQFQHQTDQQHSVRVQIYKTRNTRPSSANVYLHYTEVELPSGLDSNASVPAQEDSLPDHFNKEKANKITGPSCCKDLWEYGFVFLC